MRTLLILLFLVPQFAGAQQSGKRITAERKGFIYLAGGSHRIFFTPCDIRVIRTTSPGFDFTLQRVKARDEGGLRFETAPQFSYTIGYYFTSKKFGIEYQYDHIKYFVRENQRVRVQGTINGNKIDKDTTLHPSFFRLEHSDGGNYAMFNLVKWVPLQKKPTGLRPEWLIKGGIGFVNPKTNTSILGNIRDDRYYLSGYVAGVETGFRLHAGKWFFFTGSFKGAFANYNHFLINGGHGKQQWLSGQFNYMIGGQFPL